MSSEEPEPGTTEETIEVTAFEETSAERAKASEEVLRIEHDLQVSWSGVSGCCEGRAQNEVTARFNAWRGEEIGKHSDRQYWNSGHGGGTARCTQSQAPWPDNSRSCRGGATVRAWIEFI